MKKGVFLLGVVLVVGVVGGWQQLGPNGAGVAAMTTVPGHPDEVYFVTGGFPSLVFHTADAGLTWVLRETIPDIITAIAVDPNRVQNLYAAGKTSRVYKSTNSGASWFVCGVMPGTPWVHQLVVNPENGSEIWAAAENYAGDSVSLTFYRSTNAGVNWNGTTVVSSFEVRARLLFIDPASPGRGFIGGSVANRARVFLTSDYGNSWVDRSVGLGGRCAWDGTLTPNGNIVCATDTGIYHSTDLGGTWNRRLTAPVYSVAFAPVSPYHAYAGGENLVYRSTDLGWSWQVDTTSFFGTGTRWLGIVGSLEVYAGNGYGLFHSTNGGYDWAYRTGNFRNLDLPLLFFTGGETLFAGVEGYGVVRSTDGGVSWVRWGKAFPGSGWVNGLAVNSRHPDTVVCVTSFDSRLHLTINAGDSWETFNIASNFEPRGVAYHPLGQDTLYVWGGRRDSTTGRLRFALLRSTDRGQTWSSVLWREAGVCLGLVFSPDAETIFVYGRSGSEVIFRSVDRGRNWVSLSSGISGSPVTDFKVMPGNSSVLFCTTPVGVFKSENGGGYWTNIGVAGATGVLPDTVNPNRVWAATDTQGFFFTTNNGIIWNRDTLGVTGRAVRYIYRHPGRRDAIYAGVVRSSLVGKNVSGLEEERLNFVPSAVRVLPAVARSAVRILVGPEVRQVAVYDPTGRRVSLIPVPPGSRGGVNWRRPQGISAGVYIVVGQGGGGTPSARMVLVP